MNQPIPIEHQRHDAQHGAQHGAFVARTEPGLAAHDEAACHYRLDGRTLVLHHTVVPAALQGRGLAAQLVAAALAWARAEGLRVRPTCSYVATYLQRHPKEQDLLEGR